MQDTRYDRSVSRENPEWAVAVFSVALRHFFSRGFHSFRDQKVNPSTCVGGTGEPESVSSKKRLRLKQERRESKGSSCYSSLGST